MAENFHPQTWSMQLKWKLNLKQPSPFACYKTKIILITSWQKQILPDFPVKEKNFTAPGPG